MDATPEEVWNGLLFYEEVPGNAPILLRAFLSAPLRAEGDKSRLGERVRCVYGRGDLVKRITAVDPPRLLQFEVAEQNLGIENCILTCGGSYTISPRGGGTDVALVTRYRTYLAPRALWRPVEAVLVRGLHRHIIAGVSRGDRQRKTYRFRSHPSS